MENFFTVGHSFNSGDIITILPGLRKVWQETGKKAIIYQRLNIPAEYGHSDNHPVKDQSGVQVCMNNSMFDKLKPLIESQEYIESFNQWEGQEVDFDFDKTRQSNQLPLPGGSIHKWASLIFPQLECDLGEPWIDVEPIEDIPFKNNIVINLTERYRIPYVTYYFMQKYERDAFFVGTRTEHALFCEQNDLNVAYLKVRDFLELARVIKSCKFFMGNQSFCWHLADAMKVPRILEVCAAYPNTFPTGKDGYSFVTQLALEYFVDKLMIKP